MSELTVSLGEDERSRALDALVPAFAADPVERWLYPQPDSYLRPFLVAFGGRPFAEQTAWEVGQCLAVALWLPPGAEVTAQAQAGSCPPITCMLRPAH